MRLLSSQRRPERTPAQGPFPSDGGQGKGQHRGVARGQGLQRGLLAASRRTFRWALCGTAFPGVGALCSAPLPCWLSSSTLLRQPLLSGDEGRWGG